MLAASLPVRLALLALLVTIAYAGALRAGVAWDDIIVISGNRAIRSLAHPWRFFTDPTTIGVTSGSMLFQYRPLRTLLYAIEYAIFGASAWGFHLVSLALHVVAAWLLGRVAGSLFGRGAWLAATIWLLHPALSEPALYLAAQGNLLCLVLSLACILAHLRWLAGGRASQRVASWLLAFAAMASYEFGAVLPLLLAIAELVRADRGGRLRLSVIARHLPHWLVLAAFLALRSFVVPSLSRPTWWEGSWTRSVLLELRVWVEAWRLTIVPIGQRIRYLPPEIPSFATIEVAVLLHVALGVIVFRAATTGKGRTFAACVVWWYVAQAPTSNIIVANLSYLFAPRFLFLALALPVAAFAGWLASRGRLASGVTIAALVLAGIPLIRQQVGVWQSPLTLFGSLVKASPQDVSAHYLLGEALRTCGEPRRAALEFETARALAPGYAPTWLQVGDARLRAGDHAAARAAFGRHVQLQPGSVLARIRLAELAVLGREPDQARTWLATAVQAAPREGGLGTGRELAVARIELALGERDAAYQRVASCLSRLPDDANTTFQAGVLLAYTRAAAEGRPLLRLAAEQIGVEYADRIGDTGRYTEALAPAFALTPPRRFASFCLPMVGP